MISKGQSKTKSSSTKTGTQSSRKKVMSSKTTKSRQRSSGSKAAVVPEDLPNKDIHFQMSYVKDNPDGSADYSLDMNEYTQAKLIEIGVIALLKEHIAQKKKQPWYKRWFSFNTNCTGHCNQGRSCDCK